jgi:hypothetical protein
MNLCVFFPCLHLAYKSNHTLLCYWYSSPTGQSPVSHPDDERNAYVFGIFLLTNDVVRVGLDGSDVANMGNNTTLSHRGCYGASGAKRCHITKGIDIINNQLLLFPNENKSGLNSKQCLNGGVLFFISRLPNVFTEKSHGL